MTRSERIAAHIAARIIRNKSLPRFSTLYREAIEETMSTTTDQTTNPTLNQSANSGAPARVGVAKLPSQTVVTQVVVGPVKQVGHNSFEGSNSGEHRAQAADSVLPSNPGPREPRGQSKVGGGE